MESKSEAEKKKDIPLRKMPYSACVLSGREQEGRNINSREDESGLYCYCSELKWYMLLYHWPQFLVLRGTVSFSLSCPKQMVVLHVESLQDRSLLKSPQQKSIICFTFNKINNHNFCSCSSNEENYLYAVRL